MVRLLSLAVLLVLSNTASAFYFEGWPGARRPPVPVLVTNASIGDPPSVTPPVIPETVPNNPENPNGVPEPATLVLGAIGAAALYGRKKLQAKKMR